MSDFLDELKESDYSADSERMSERYTLIQWHRGQKAMKNAGGLAYTGGFAVQTDKMLGDFDKLGWPEEEIELGQNMKACSVSAHAHIAVIRTRFRWEITDDKPDGYGRLQILALVKGANDPVVFTFRATTSQEMEQCLRDFQNRAIVPLEKLAGKRQPFYSIWMPLKAGPHTYAKAKKGTKQSEVTPPTLVLPDVVDREWLAQRYTGKAVLEAAQALFRSTADWAAEWKKEPGTGEADAETWACGAGLRREFYAVLERLTGGDGSDADMWINDALAFADAEKLDAIPAKLMRSFIDTMKSELASSNVLAQNDNKALAAAAGAKREAIKKALENAPPVNYDDEIPF